MRTKEEVVPIELASRPAPAPSLGWSHPAGFEDLIGVRRPGAVLWRRVLRLGPSPKERFRWEQARLARTPIQGRCALVAVLARKGGVGKSTVTALLASTFGCLRADRVVALDAAAEIGNLADRLTVEGVQLNTRDLARAELEGRADVSRFVVCDPQARLEVVAAPLEGDDILSRECAEQLLWVLGRSHSLILADCGTTLAEPATALVVEESEQALVVTTAAEDSLRLACLTLDHLERMRGRAWVQARVCVVVNACLDGRAAERAGGVFASRQVAWRAIRFDPHLHAGGRFDWSSLQAGLAEDYLALAGLVGKRFGLPAATPLGIKEET